jgi:TRAP transporter TAXI family solute receptor
VEELRGKRVDVGTPQSGTRLNAIGVLQAHGIALQDLAQARGEGTRAAIADLRAGHIDAFVLTVGAPAQVLQRLAAEHPIRLLPVSSAAAARLVGEQRGLVALALPANTYPGQSEAVATVAPTALLAAAIDTPGDEVKALLELAFERTDYLASGSAQGVKIAKATGLRGVPIPLHPAAAAYFGSAPKASGVK